MEHLTNGYTIFLLNNKAKIVINRYFNKRCYVYKGGYCYGFINARQFAHICDYFGLKCTFSYFDFFEFTKEGNAEEAKNCERGNRNEVHPKQAYN